MAALASFLSLVLAGAALHKLLRWQSLSGSAARLVGGSSMQGQIALTLAATVEIFAALALWTEPTRAVGSIMAAALWLAYAGALYRRRGETLDCGCDLAAREKPVGAFAIARPLGLAGLALLLPFGPAMAWTAETPFAALGLLALYLAASELGAISSIRKRGAR